MTERIAISRSRRNAGLALAALVVIGLVAWYLTIGSTRTTSGPPAGPPVTVGIARAEMADIPVAMTAIGSVQPLVTATVRTQLAGVLFSLHFTEGQLVTKGQLIAEIDPRPYRLALQQAQSNLARDQAQLDIANLDLQRYKTLLAQDAIARQQEQTQEGTVRQLTGTVSADIAAMGTAKLNLAYTAVTAPASGRIGLRQVDIGNYLTPNDPTGIAVITQLAPIDIGFSLPQNEIPALQDSLASGTPLPVTATNQDGSSVLDKGSFLTLDNTIDPTSGTVKAKARFPNTGGKLFPSQFVNVSVLANTLRHVVTVPVSAVRHGAQGDFVFLLRPHRTVRLQVVKTGPTDIHRIAILSGVPAGAIVITEGADNLDDGSSVTLASDVAAGSGTRH